MRAVILAGGKGTRLRPYTTVLPKPLVPIGERPILELIIHQLGRAGFEQVDFLVGHLGELIRAYLVESGAVPAGMKMRFIFEEEPLGTAGALHQIEPPDQSFLVMNGDILTTLDYADFMRHHHEQGGALTIATFKKDVELALGVLKGPAGEPLAVTDYVEKPTLHYDVSMGIYAYSPTALQHVPEGHFDFPDLVLKLIAAGERVVRYPFDGEWFDIGTPAEHERADQAFNSDSARFNSQLATSV